MNKIIRRTSSFVLAIVMSCILSMGCGRTEAMPVTPAAQAETSAPEATTKQQETSATEASISALQSDTPEAEVTASAPQPDTPEAEVTASAPEPESSPAQAQIAEDGSYNSKEDVALYLHVYGKLPGNYITKKEAKKLGWSGGSLEDYAPGKCIGGDYFGNNEGLLPEDADYHECDIDTLGKEKRGAKRIIYSDDGYIYYTEDHYQSFEQLYGPDN